MSALEDWQRAIKLAEEAGVDGWAVMNHDPCRTAIAELQATIERLTKDRLGWAESEVREHNARKQAERERDGWQAQCMENSRVLKQAEAKVAQLERMLQLASVDIAIYLGEPAIRGEDDPRVGSSSAALADLRARAEAAQ